MPQFDRERVTSGSREEMLWAEVLGLRALLTTWFEGELAAHPQRMETLKLLDETAQERVRHLYTLTGAAPESEAIIRETAALRISEFVSELTSPSW